MATFWPHITSSRVNLFTLVHCALLQFVKLLALFRRLVSGLSLTSLFNFFFLLSAALRLFYLGGMLTTPGIVTVLEFTPLKAFLFIHHPSSVPALLSLRSVSVLYCVVFHLCFCCVKVHTRTLSHTLLLLLLLFLLSYQPVLGTSWHRLSSEHPSLSSTTLTVSRTSQSACF